jgi:hypothetical protein
VFPSHRIDHPHFDNSIILEGWSYVWASLFGPFYVLYHGFKWRALAMLGLSIVIAAAAAGIVAVIAVAMDAVTIVIPAMVVTPLVGLVIQGLIAIQLVFLGYLKRGWREGY